MTDTLSQYTDGTGHSPNLPQGCPPFGNCDMNSVDGLTPQQFAAACGITTNLTPVDAIAAMKTDVENLRPTQPPKSDA